MQGALRNSKFCIRMRCLILHYEHNENDTMSVQKRSETSGRERGGT